MSKLEAARDLVRSFPLPDALRAFRGEDGDGYTYWNGANTRSTDEPLSGDILADSLQTVIQFEMTPIEDEQAVPLGSSKYRGLPHLPPDFEWPAGQFFAAQLNLAELHHLDATERFPDRGMLYFFFNGGADATVFHYDGPLDKLAIRPYPDAKTLPEARYYLEGFLNGAALLTPKPGYLFYVNQGDAFDYEPIAQLIPADLRAQLDALLCGTLLDSNNGTQVFGRPLFWQGEDEDMSEFEGDDDEDGEDDDEGDDDDDGDEDDEGDEDGAMQASSDSDLLLFQDEFGEGNIHFRLSEAELRARRFDQAYLTYSGT